MSNDFEGKLIADKYRLGDLLRESDSGDLYTGRHEFMDKAVTIKVLPRALAMDSRWSKRFLDGARNAATVSHPNILNATDFGADSRGVIYSVFESAPDETLRSVIAREGSLDVDRTLNIAKQVASGVAAAHAKNVIHAGLMPADIYLIKNEDGTETAKVCGFGGDTLSVPRDADPRYLSPEQTSEYPVATPRSDIYSLGVIIYEMLAGVSPVEGKTSTEVKQKREQEPPPPLSAFRRDLPADLEPMILSALALDPERRYPTMAAFAEDLNLLSGGTPAPAVAAEAAAPKKNVWQTAFIVLAGISLLAVALIYATNIKKTDPTTELVADAGSLPVQPIGPATGAQEESLAKLPEMTDAEIMAAATGTMAVPPGTLPGGDGYNAWANGGAPPIGAPAPMTQQQQLQ
ncbi:MAG TPA: serine/threonine-protein kinase, partial [Pyrinomonadaceae bacterium]|nr:serine/threonine-protein kinase [Pyrinomonadaceae bacterium]